jgi:hypothetical protein
MRNVPCQKMPNCIIINTIITTRHQHPLAVQITAATFALLQQRLQVRMVIWKAILMIGNLSKAAGLDICNLLSHCHLSRNEVWLAIT